MGTHTEPDAEFRALEDRLVNATAVHFDFHVTAEGAVEADLRGVLDMGPADRVQLTAAGRFGGQPVDLLLRSEGGEYEFGSRTDPTTAATSAHLKEALLIGLTRMGILHNLARLSSANPPDHAEGGVREWVRIGPFAARENDGDPLSFDLTVAGRRAGSASIEIDPDGRPAVRRQTVEFPEGTMRVVERYSAVTFAP